MDSESSGLEIVFLVGAMNGHLRIERQKAPSGRWLFHATCDLSILESMFEEVGEEAPDLVEQYFDRVSFEEALASLDQYSWHKLTVLNVHPDYQDRVLAEVRRLSGDEDAARLRETLRSASARTGPGPS